MEAWMTGVPLRDEEILDVFQHVLEAEDVRQEDNL